MPAAAGLGLPPNRRVCGNREDKKYYESARTVAGMFSGTVVIRVMNYLCKSKTVKTNITSNTESESKSTISVKPESELINRQQPDPEMESKSACFKLLCMRVVGVARVRVRVINILEAEVGIGITSPRCIDLSWGLNSRSFTRKKNLLNSALSHQTFPRLFVFARNALN